MEEVDISLIVSILITMVFSAFFSGMEIAFVSSNRMLAEMDKEKNGLTQRLLSLFYNHPNGFVSTMLVGNNIALVVYGILIARLFDNTIFAGLDDGVKVTCDCPFSPHLSCCLPVSSCRRRFSSRIQTDCCPSSVRCVSVLRHSLAYQQVQYLPQQGIATYGGYERWSLKRGMKAFLR